MQIWWVPDPCGRNYVFIAQSLLAASGLCGALALRSGVLLAWHEGTWTLAAWAHLACALSDPGAVPRGAAEALAPEELGDVRWCKHCQVAKPPRAHHCSTCQRCIRKMDHHCMWMNNCIGANNQKHFLLFLIYTSAHCLGVPLRAPGTTSRTSAVWRGCCWRGAWGGSACSC
ncbi:unnamed protein product [Effrenium voratum]|uniref:Palmitoyltransferase n=1 Tax=Effrenium voratum TaxID=2562239 RepID=A0AA36MH76_9DINO|nr:unnamed protein product [Effrenium voratum]